MTSVAVGRATPGAALRWRIRGRAAEAAVLLVVAGAAQRWVPMRRWTPVVGRPAEVPDDWRGVVSPALPARAADRVEHRVARAIAAGGRRLPWAPTCLAEAAAAQVMLRRRRAGGVMVVGLRPAGPGEPWQAHAWLLGRRGAVTGGWAAAGFTATTVFEVPGGLRARDVDLD